jgi:peptidoglycan/LPS O-acetylase OafA/YrhL
MGSALRIGSLKTFITFRVLRILPALATEITLSALVLGPLLTEGSLSAYYSDTRFYFYFGSLIGRVRYILPNLFMSNPVPEVVNGALWTVGPEILCYVGMAVLLITGLYKKILGLLCTIVLFVAVCLISDWMAPPVIHEVLPTKALILGFLAGTLLYHLRHYVTYSIPLAFLAATLAAAAILLATKNAHVTPLIYVAVSLLAYVVVTIGLSDLPKLPFFHRGDYSYGIYIYGFPIQQSITHFLPGYREWWINFSLALPLTLVFAVLSWTYVEKPVLGLRKKILARRDDGQRPSALSIRRRGALLAALAAYGIFVAYAANVFPVAQIYHKLSGRVETPATAVAQPVGL